MSEREIYYKLDLSEEYKNMCDSCMYQNLTGSSVDGNVYTDCDEFENDLLWPIPTCNRYKEYVEGNLCRRQRCREDRKVSNKHFITSVRRGHKVEKLEAENARLKELLKRADICIRHFPPIESDINEDDHNVSVLLDDIKKELE